MTLFINFTPTDSGAIGGLSAPEVRMLSPLSTFPPEFDWIIPTEINVETTDIRMQIATDLGFASVVHTQTISPIGTGALDFTDLDLITSGAYYYRWYFIQGSDRGPYSTVFKHGDIVPPTITNGNTASGIEGTVNPTVQFTADEDVTWEVTGGPDASFISIDANGLATINDTTDYYFGQRNYVFDITAIDYAGNLSTPQEFTYNVNANPLVTPPAQLAWHLFDKSTYITTSGTPPRIASTSGFTNPVWVRALISHEQSNASTKFQVEFTINSLTDAILFIGLDHGTDDLSNYRFMGAGSGYHGICCQIQNGTQYYNENEGNVGSSGIAIADGDIIGIRVDKAGSAEFYRMRSGAYTTMQTISFTPFGTDYYANMAFWGGNTPPQMTVNFGDTTFARALSAGYTRY